MPPKYPTAKDLLEVLEHCSQCGETNPDEADGDSTCCGRRICRPDGTAQDACCAAVQQRMEDEAADARPAARPAARPRRKKEAEKKEVSDHPPARPPARETRGLQDASGDANLVSHPGGNAPKQDDTKEQAMENTTATPDTAEGTPVRTQDGVTGVTRGVPALTPSGHVVSVDYDAEFAHLSPTGGADFAVTELEVITEDAAEEAPEADVIRVVTRNTRSIGSGERDTLAYVHTNCPCTLSSGVKGTFTTLTEARDLAKGLVGGSNAKVIACKKSTPVRVRQDQAPAPVAETEAAAPAPAEAAPATQAEAQEPAEAKPAKKATAAPKKARRAALGPASAEGWELLYDKPKQNCEVGRNAEGGYALICKEHKHVHPVARLTMERTIRANGGWCPECVAAK